MIKLFFDHLLDLGKVDKTIKKVSSSHEEKLELWRIVDEIVHHKVISCVLDHLPLKHHGEFMKKYLATPHDEKLLLYLKAKIKKDIELIIKETVTLFVIEITDELVGNNLKSEG